LKLAWFDSKSGMTVCIIQSVFVGDWNLEPCCHEQIYQKIWFLLPN
jgi:hypothetical protein